MRKESRGGKREGAGRPVTGNSRIKTSITLKQDDKEWLNKRKEKTADLIDLAFKLLREYKT